MYVGVFYCEHVIIYPARHCTNSCSIKRKTWEAYNRLSRHLWMWIVAVCSPHNNSTLFPLPIELHLIRLYCLSYLSYCIGALELPVKVIHQWSVCSNEELHRVFSFERYESAKELQYFCGEEPFHDVYDLATWNFHICLVFNGNTVVNVLYKVMVKCSKGIHFDCEKYCTKSSKLRRFYVVFVKFARDLYS